MGSYINIPEMGPKHKAEFLLAIPGCSVARPPDEFAFSQIPDDLMFVCVVQNGPFDAAAICYDLGELRWFSRADDPRPKTWILAPRTLLQYADFDPFKETKA